jgi:sulfite reductase (ferredoxin)
VWAGVTGIFRDYGYRRSRNHARLKFLMADWGPQKFRKVLEDEYLEAPLPDGPPPPASPSVRDHTGIRPQNNGLFSVGGTTRSGRTSGTELAELAVLAERFGAGRAALTAQQGVVVIDVAEAETAALAEEMTAIGFVVHPSAFLRGTIACTGIEFCKLALVETKVRAETIRLELEKRLPDFDTPISINVNGCPNSCARFQVADIGFKGVVQKGPDGDEDAFQVHLGGVMGENAEFGRKFRGLKVTAEQAPDYAERVLRGYRDRRSDGESFAEYVQRAEEAWLV